VFVFFRTLFERSKFPAEKALIELGEMKGYASDVRSERGKEINDNAQKERQVWLR
jgi:hypothetical protein